MIKMLMNQSNSECECSKIAPFRHWIVTQKNKIELNPNDIMIKMGNLFGALLLIFVNCRIFDWKGRKSRKPNLLYKSPAFYLNLRRFQLFKSKLQPKNNSGNIYFGVCNRKSHTHYKIVLFFNNGAP